MTKRKVRPQRSFEDPKQLRPINIQGPKYAKGQSSRHEPSSKDGDIQKKSTSKRDVRLKEGSCYFLQFYFFCNSFES
ncbi:hypothetical protein SESBI_44367 [Sesbania bispinosa]|nr:hypothetical protein SESBI_44367 [Sesbania bispinosa]